MRIKMTSKHKHYTTKQTYEYNGKTQYSYRMFDQLKNATDYLLELTLKGKYVKLYESTEIAVEYNVTIKEKTIKNVDKETLNNVIDGYGNN